MPTVISVPTAELLTVAEGLSDVRVVQWDLVGSPPLSALDLVVAPYMSPPAMLTALTGVSVRAVQSQSVGYDGVAEHLPPGIVFCNAAGVHEASTAELAVALTLASISGLAAFFGAQTAGRWAHEERGALADRRVIVVGAGGVGQAIVRRLEGFESDVVQVGRTERVGEHGVVHATTALAHLLPSADVVILAIPLSDETTGMVDAAFLAQMKRGALVVNVSRGAVIDTEALLAAVRERDIRAALDVTDPEPLPRDHPLWHELGVIITPHVGGHSTAMAPRVRRLIREQAGRLSRGEPLANVVIGTVE